MAFCECWFPFVEILRLYPIVSLDPVWLVLGIPANGQPKDGNPHQKSPSRTIGTLKDSAVAKLESGVRWAEKSSQAKSVPTDLAGCGVGGYDWGMAKENPYEAPKAGKPRPILKPDAVMNVAFDLTIDDFIDFNLSHQRRSPILRAIVLSMFIVVWIAVPIGIAFYLLSASTLDEFLILYAAVHFLVFGFLVFRIARRGWSMVGDYELTISPAAIRQSSSIRWESGSFPSFK